VKVDFLKILGRLNTRQIVRAIVYHVEVDAVKEAGFIHRVQKMGYEVKTKKLKTYSNGKKKADWDVGIAMDAVSLADKVDVVCIVSGDGDYVPLVQYLKSRGVKVEIMAFESCTSGDLKRVADEFYPIKEDMLLDPDSAKLNQAA
jgi:uncharacterized LabA/DUF88 family protein